MTKHACLPGSDLQNCKEISFVQFYNAGLCRCVIYHLLKQCEFSSGAIYHKVNYKDRADILCFFSGILHNKQGVTVML